MFEETMKKSEINKVEETRHKVDLISYNIRYIFHGALLNNTDLSESANLKPVDIAEIHIKLVDEVVELLEQLTHNPISESTLPIINSVISSTKIVQELLSDFSEKNKGYLSDKYMEMYLDRIYVLKEVIEDVEMVFFEIPNNKEFQAAMNELSNL